MATIKVAPVKPAISFDVLEKIDIRVGTIKLIEDVKGSNKLLKMTVDFGDHTRTILVGMKQERQDPKEIEGVQALFVINLEPRKLMGEVSEGMLLDIGYADGIKPVLALPEAEVPNGARAGGPLTLKTRRQFVRLKLVDSFFPFSFHNKFQGGIYDRYRGSCRRSAGRLHPRQEDSALIPDGNRSRRVERHHRQSPGL